MFNQKIKLFRELFKKGNLYDHIFYSFILLALLYLSMLNIPSRIATTNLDQSWAQCLSYFYEKGFQPGIDYIFTYGPLGWLRTGAFNSFLFTSSLLLKSTLLIIYVIFLQRLLKKMESKSLQIFTVLFFVLSYRIIYLNLALLLFFELAYIKNEKPYSGLLKTLYFVILVVISYTKFSYFIFIFSSFVLYVLFNFIKTRDFIKCGKIAFIIIFLYFAVWYLATFNYVSLFYWAYASYQITKSYTSSMATFRNNEIIAIGIFVACFLFSFYSFYTSYKKNKSTSLLLVFIIFCLYSFLIFKSSFVRYGPGHVAIFSSCYPVALIFLLSYFDENFKMPYKFIMFPVIVILSMIILIFYCWQFRPLDKQIGGVFRRIDRNISSFGSLSEYKQKIRKKRQSLKARLSSKKLKKIIMNSTVDIIQVNHQGMLLLNEYNYSPRPVFQSYLAYNSFLKKKNLRFYMDDLTAPEYLIFKAYTIDNRFPLQDDSLSLLYIFQRYSILDRDEQYLILERNREAPIVSSIITEEKTIFLNKPFKTHFSDKCFYTISLEFRRNILGKIANFLYKNPVIYMKINKKHIYRINPDNFKDEVLISPSLITNNDILNYSKNRSLPRALVTDLEIFVDNHIVSFYRNRIFITIRKYPEMAFFKNETGRL